MNALDQLNAYLDRLESRLAALRVFERHVACYGLGPFGDGLPGLDHQSLCLLSASLLWARILLFISVATAIAFGLVIPLLRLNRRNAARRAERELPGLPGAAADSG